MLSIQLPKATDKRVVELKYLINSKYVLVKVTLMIRALKTTQLI